MQDLFKIRLILGGILMWLWPLVTCMADITYEITTYGARHAVIILRGTTSGLTANLGGDGLSIRISSNIGNFLEGQKQNYGSFIASVQQVQRGVASDLVVNLNLAAELSITPGVDDIKLIVKGRKDSVNQSSPNVTQPPIKGRKQPKGPLPIKLIGHKDYALEPKDGKIIGITFVLPELDQVTALTQLSQELKNFSYVLDVLWSWVTGTDLSGNPQISEPSNSGVACTEVAELETLVKDLTQELIELRKIKLEKSNSKSS